MAGTGGALVPGWIASAKRPLGRKPDEQDTVGEAFDTAFDKIIITKEHLKVNRRVVKNQLHYHTPDLLNADSANRGGHQSATCFLKKNT